MVRVCLFSLFVAIPVFTSAISVAQDTSQELEPYTLLPGDVINISVWKEPELQKDVIVRPDGRFSFPLVGDVTAIGKSVTEIQQEMSSKLERYIPEPVLTVTVTEPLGNKIYVIGQVQKPGQYIVNPMVDVVQALSMAGGMTPFAAVNDIIVIRRNSGKQSVMSFRYGDIEKGRNLEQNLLLKPGDVVIVP